MRAPLLPAVLLACTGDPSTPEGEPGLEIVSPADGATVCGAPLHVELDVRNFELIEPGDEEGDLPEGAGHVDLTLNGQVVNMTAETAFELEVEAGEYQLRAELVNADHSPIEPYVGSTVYFTVDEATCAR